MLSGIPHMDNPYTGETGDAGASLMGSRHWNMSEDDWTRTMKART